MSVATLASPPPSSSTRTLGQHFLRNLSSLLITSRLIGQSLSAVRSEFVEAPEIDKKITELITTGQRGVLPATPQNDGASRLVATTLYNGLPTEGAPLSRSADTVVNLRLLAQHLELRARLTAEEAKLMGEETLRRALLNWARQWWTVARP
jgi:hypothetical protein